ncbi:hypothetical protein QA648_28320 (plasmid) [Rhizobium sp. CB3171]|uniref:hypothetical protein n=1 Tax=Rhizobium sp. CB3171 TaxID=3039157 RepID=UPI0024B079C5|nr:hypothetical protein [Rhizobium sp. CB3171]WFU04675.1 hypothetical protein QA648_28320 [Rhizobium sp. CB3171]
MAMAQKEILVVNSCDGELDRFLERLRAAGEITVVHRGEQFVVELRQDQITQAAREFLSKGGPSTE